MFVRLQIDIRLMGWAYRCITYYPMLDIMMLLLSGLLELTCTFLVRYCYALFWMLFRT